MRWMEIAWAEDGTHEIAGVRANSQILAYFRDCGRSDITSDETAWCAAFVGACLARARIRTGLSDADKLRARAYLKVGTPIDAPRPGAIAVFARGSNPSQGHVGFVTGWTDDHIRLLGGNQRNSVCEVLMPRDMLVGLRWPAEPVGAHALAEDSRIVSAAKGQQTDAVKLGAAQTAGQTLPAPDSLGLEGLAAQAGSLKGSVETLEAFAVFALGKAGWIAGVLGCYLVLRMAWRAGWIKSWRVEDHNTGKTGADAQSASEAPGKEALP